MPTFYFKSTAVCINSNIGFWPQNEGQLFFYNNDKVSHDLTRTMVQWLDSRGHVDDIREDGTNHSDEAHQHTGPTHHVGPTQPGLDLVLATVDQRFVFHLKELY